MKPLSLAGLIGLASLGAQAQAPYWAVPAHPLQPIVVTATRSLQAAAPTLRDAIVVTREELDEAGNLSLAEVLLRRAGVEFRATGGPGQPTGLFIRGANTAHTLVLVDGVRLSSAIGTTSVENIPLEMVERIEVVKGPLSSLYGSDAIGGVVQIFTRGKKVPHFFATTSFGEDNDRRVSAGATGADALSSFSVNLGGRKVDAPSATNRRNFCHDPDRDPHENAFFEAKAAHRLWQGETISISAFVTRGKTRFDGCPDFDGRIFDDLNTQTLTGVAVTSSTQFLPGWNSRLAYHYGRDDIRITGSFPGAFETQQDQLSWVNEIGIGSGAALLAGAELLRQRVLSAGDAPFARDRRDIDALFAGMNQTWAGQRFEGSVRVDRDKDDAQFGTRTTGSASYGAPWPGWGMLSATYGTGFRTPTFFDLYGPTSDFYRPNPELLPERSRSREIALRSEPGKALQWRLTAFDIRIEDLIAFVVPAGPGEFPTVRNVKRAHIRGVEANLDLNWIGVRWRAALTAQRPRDDESGKRLPGRTERLGSLDASKRIGDAWTLGATVLASGDRYDSVDESPSTRLSGYALVDARVRYAVTKRWSVELNATNLLDRKYESAVGYDAPRRGVMLNLRFEAF